MGRRGRIAPRSEVRGEQGTMSYTNINTTKDALYKRH